MPVKTTKKNEKIEFLRGYSARSLSGRAVVRLGRFLFIAKTLSPRYGSNPVWIVCYRGKAERLVLCKDLVINNPHVISDDWLEKNKGKFNDPEGAGDLIIKKEFKNFPYFGITPHRILKRLGVDASLVLESGYAILYFTQGSGETVPPFLASLAH